MNSIFTSVRMKSRRALSIWATMAFITTALAGCGGGGVDSGDSAAPTGATLTLSPATATLDAGQSMIIRITGGKGPYRMVSGNPQILPVPGSINNANAANVSITAGDVRETQVVEIVATDYNGQVAKAAITVRYVAMAVTPSALTLASGRSQTFRIVGGKLPFTVTSSRPDLMIMDTGNLASKEFSVFANDVTTQVDDVTISIMDAAGNTVVAKLSIMPLQIFDSVQVNPSSTSGGSGTVGAIVAGQSGLVTIQMGSGYSLPRTLYIDHVMGAFSLDGANSQGGLTVEAGADGVALSTLTTTAGAATQTARLRVTDSLTGKFVETGFQIAGAAFAVSPATISAFSDTSACLNGVAGVVQIMGGTPPYTILSATPTIVTATPATITQSGGSTTLSAKGVCTDTTGVKLAATDAAGAALSVVFTNTARPVTALQVLPATLSAATGSILNLTIAGGTPPYTAVSSNTETATILFVTGSQVSVTTVAAGSSDIVVKDAASLTATSVLTVQ